MWSREELAWLAGLFEGEGSISSFANKGGGWRINTSIKMTDYDVIMRAASIAGVGKVYGPYQSSYPGAKPHWQWNVQRSTEAYALMVALWPWLGTRRRARVVEAVTAWVAVGDSLRSERRLGRERGPDGRYLAGLRP